MSSPTRYRIRHETAYTYASDVVHSHQLLHLVPRPAPYQQCLEHRIDISPAAYRRRDDLDAFGNPVTRVEFEHPHRSLEVTTDMEVEVHARPPIPVAETVPWERVFFDLGYHGRRSPSRETLEASRFRHESPYVRVKRMFTEYAADCFPSGGPILACAEALMTKLHREVKYAPGETTIATPLTEVFKNRRGVCQDFAHLMIACLRSRGLAARYVSGYVRSLVGSAASHAWVAVYSPPFGWLELDPTNDTLVGTDHIAVAWGRDFGDVSPLRGIILGGGTHHLAVSVKVERLHG
jgi:transglutaminase-like putative cysteine protease